MNQLSVLVLLASRSSGAEVLTVAATFGGNSTVANVSISADEHEVNIIRGSQEVVYFSLKNIG